MDYEDRIVIPTPEGIEVDYILAGVGSRFVSEIVDWLLRGAVLTALAVVLAVIKAGTIGAIIFLVALFCALFVYDIAFEVWGGGRTPAKRWNGLRVVRLGGQPVGFTASATRNLLRIIDEELTLFIGGAICCLLTKRNQRIGDLAAGTIVIREPVGSDRLPQRAPVVLDSVAAQLDLTALSAAELAAVREFLSRRDGLTREARSRVAQRLVERLVPKIGGLPPERSGAEQTLETIAAAARAR